MADDDDHGQKFAGTVVFRVQVVGAVAFIASLVFCVEATTSRPEFGTLAGLMMIASALSYGLLANAVLRR